MAEPKRRRRVEWVSDEVKKRLQPGESPWEEPHLAEDDDSGESGNDARLLRDKPPHW